MRISILGVSVLNGLKDELECLLVFQGDKKVSVGEIKAECGVGVWLHVKYYKVRKRK